MSSKEINFPYPLGLTLLHMVFSSVLCFVLTKVLKVFILNNLLVVIYISISNHFNAFYTSNLFLTGYEGWGGNDPWDVSKERVFLIFSRVWGFIFWSLGTPQCGWTYVHKSNPTCHQWDLKLHHWGVCLGIEYELWSFKYVNLVCHSFSWLVMIEYNYQSLIECESEIRMWLLFEK